MSDNLNKVVEEILKDYRQALSQQADDAFSSNLRNELEALLAQEKAKWVAEVESVIPKERNTDVGDAYQRTFCGEYNKALKEVRQALQQYKSNLLEGLSDE